MAVNSVGNQKTIQEIIDSTKKSTGDRNTGALGKDDFLNLLVTQLRYQDPLKPMEDKEFIAQMAQFSSLEQMQNMNTTITQSQAFSLLGKGVTATVSDEKTKEPKVIQGIVTNVKISSGKSYAVVNGQDVPVDRITNVTESGSTGISNLSAYTSIIGYNVNGVVYDSTTSHIVAVNGKVSALEKGAYEDYAVMDNVTVDIAGVYTKTPSTDPDFTTKYLDERLPANGKPGKEVELWLTDRKTGDKVAVKAILNSYEKDAEGKIKVNLDRVYVPVDSISKITK